MLFPLSTRTDKRETSENFSCRTMSDKGSVDEIKVEEIDNEAAQTVESGELSEGKKSFFLFSNWLGH